jgi:hypothetical protein
MVEVQFLSSFHQQLSVFAIEHPTDDAPSFHDHSLWDSHSIESKLVALGYLPQIGV